MYGRTVENQTLTFCVSGMLWNRSLVMMDTQTRSLWSHILGEAMAGQHKGKELKMIPSDMTTWAAWKRAHTDTTVLALPRTRHDEYTKEFYRDPGKFVVGFVGNDGIFHCSFAALNARPLMNTDAGGLPLLITFDEQSTSARLFSRELDDRVLTFDLTAGAIRDRETGSTWDRITGKATTGQLKGRSLETHVGIVSYTDRWLAFHPDSREARE